MEPKPRVSITYCTQCRWLLRAAWLAQELLTTFEDELGKWRCGPVRAAFSRSGWRTSA